MKSANTQMPMMKPARPSPSVGYRRRDACPVAIAAIAKLGEPSQASAAMLKPINPADCHAMTAMFPIVATTKPNGISAAEATPR